MTRFLTLFALILALSAPAWADVERCSLVWSAAADPTEAQATFDVINLSDQTSTANTVLATAVDAEDEFITPLSITEVAIRADVDVAPGAGDEWQVVLLDDGAETTGTCTISGTATSCSKDLGLLGSAVAAGSDLTLLIDGSGGATAPAAAADLRVGVCAR